MVLYYSWHFQPVTILAESASPSAVVPEHTLALSKEAFVNMVVSKELYLNKSLTLIDLANSFKTNRTYMGKYLNSVCEQPFSPYIICLLPGPVASKEFAG